MNDISLNLTLLFKPGRKSKEKSNENVFQKFWENKTMNCIWDCKCIFLIFTFMISGAKFITNNQIKICIRSP